MSDQTAQFLSLDQFAAHFERATSVLWCVAAGVLGSREGAEDAVQDAALQAMAKLSTFQPGTDFTAWMAKIVRFTALNQMRRVRRGPQLLDPEAPHPEAPHAAQSPVNASGELEPDQACLDDEVMRGLRGLHETQRSCLLLRTVLELPYSQIGKMLKIPEGTAMSHVHRARQQLVDQLRKDRAAAADARRIR